MRKFLAILFVLCCVAAGLLIPPPFPTKVETISADVPTVPPLSDVGPENLPSLSLPN